MKLVIVIISIIFFSLSSFALQENDTNVNGGFGAFGTRGALGFSVDKFLNQNHAMSFAVGLDFVGATSAIGYKYFGDVTKNSNTIWNKCFFLFKCDTHPYIGSSLQYASGSTILISESGNDREYETDAKWLGIINIGLLHIFESNFTMDLELSYRSILTGGSSRQIAGNSANDTKTIEMGYRAVGINVGIGYLF